ncbi:hypothetical protein [Vitiosangium sp. GDMCC 1.1324]|uniref:hypothetical protein n=1 Tax=Vitiosangium sp. (strain GDMCC 1.1324) TaxID=2138576 RepID=UPI000D39E025|nr:hypothetical protein [Vitiosangium sp. GDMCC 1.1324]PTL78967.1 hypothetical protein DAT35_35685 [Vitiosangium sp. GDMCC 1.1324]
MTPYQLQILDLALKTLGLLAIGIGVFTLRETRRRRLVDMYWKIYEQYFSEASRKSREDMERVEKHFGLTHTSLEVDVAREEFGPLAERYKKELHDAQDQELRAIASGALWRQRFLNQIGYLLEKRLIDPDLTFSLVGAGVDVDRQVIRIALAGYRKTHAQPNMYRGVDLLLSRYDRWKERSMA